MPQTPEERHVKTLVRKQLDPVLELLEGMPAAAIPASGPIHVHTSSEGFELTLTIVAVPRRGCAAAKPGESCKAEASPAPKPSTERLCQVHKKLLSKADPVTPKTAKRLIAEAGYKDNTYARDAITYLCRLRLLIRTPDGYLLAPSSPDTR